MLFLRIKDASSQVDMFGSIIFGSFPYTNNNLLQRVFDFPKVSVFLSMLSLPLIACIFGSYKDEKAKSASIHNFLLLGSVVCLMIACTRGNLCALKFA